MRNFDILFFLIIIYLLVWKFNFISAYHRRIRSFDNPKWKFQILLSPTPSNFLWTSRTSSNSLCPARSPPSLLSCSLALLLLLLFFSPLYSRVSLFFSFPSHVNTHPFSFPPCANSESVIAPPRANFNSAIKTLHSWLATWQAKIHHS